MLLCEIRVPTYRRPHLLERALCSLKSQTCGEWVALVMDDSPQREGREVVERLGDERIQYRPNRVRLGCARNLDQAFATYAYKGTPYACVLEDDNWYFPEFLSANIRALELSGLSILLRNQRVFFEANGSVPVESSETTRGEMLSEGMVTVLKLRASLFFCEGISNGGLFWRTSAKSSLQVGSTVNTSPMQEYCRSVMIQEPVFFAAEPLAAFSLAPQAQTLREPLANRAFNRGRQSIWRRLLRAHGRGLIEEARRMARSPKLLEQVNAALCDALALSHTAASEWNVSDVKHFAKGIAKVLTIRDPLADFWRLKGYEIFSQ